ncbi:glycosyltransferase family 4 protein [Pontibacter qinzhouensis]|uniref:Glycosyltransferase family 4 protein n=1 Tax=Pontibacter qinzhouensis TaxID=2603253 RepID=A0A5C8K5E2_9BACT|nr:glycosyltransferase family 4 protein [Pontibacter qinzhouensis]TXK44903.1 glycosyltransferase family 4 protein [Pontibacter qinzhouensis]
MKIVHIITALGFGGAERLLINFSNIHVQKHEVHIIYLKDITDLKDKLHPDIKLKIIPLGNNCSKQIRAYLKLCKPDVVNTHLSHADFLGLWACRGLKLSLFCTMHNIWFKWNKLDYIFFLIYRILFTTVARNSKVIAISKAVADHVHKRLGVSSDRIHLLYNCIPAKAEADISDVSLLRNKLQINPGNFNILFVGRLAVQKSVDTLLLAASTLKGIIPNIKVILVGEGMLRNKLEALANQLALQDVVEFRGATYHPEEYFSSCHIFVLPSIFEGMGLVILEAFRAGIPVIATNIEGPKELVQDGFNGLLTIPLDHVQLAEKIKYLWQNPTVAQKLGNQCKKSFEKQFTIEYYAAELENLYLSNNIL